MAKGKRSFLARLLFDKLTSPDTCELRLRRQSFGGKASCEKSYSRFSHGFRLSLTRLHSTIRTPMRICISNLKRISLFYCILPYSIFIPFLAKMFQPFNFPLSPSLSLFIYLFIYIIFHFYHFSLIYIQVLFTKPYLYPSFFLFVIFHYLNNFHKKHKREYISKLRNEFLF